MPGTIHCPLELWEDLKQTIQLLSTNPHITPQGIAVVATILDNMDKCKDAQFKGLILCQK
jgi:hypothetical protein